MIFLYAFILWVALVNLFVAVMHAKAVIDRGEKIHIIFLFPLYIGGFIGGVLDVIFNWTIGSLIYRELPREFTFTSRCYRHKRAVTGWRYRKAKWWCYQLNKFDPGHC